MGVAYARSWTLPASHKRPCEVRSASLAARLLLTAAHGPHAFYCALQKLSGKDEKVCRGICRKRISPD